MTLTGTVCVRNIGSWRSPLLIGPPGFGLVRAYEGPGTKINASHLSSHFIRTQLWGKISHFPHISGEIWPPNTRLWEGQGWDVIQAHLQPPAQALSWVGSAWKPATAQRLASAYPLPALVPLNP